MTKNTTNQTLEIQVLNYELLVCASIQKFLMKHTPQRFVSSIQMKGKRKIAVNLGNFLESKACTHFIRAQTQ